MAEPQVFEQTVDGVRHRVETSGSVMHRVVWSADGEPVANVRKSDSTVRIDGEESGHLTVKHSWHGAARRATLHERANSVEALAGTGGVDLQPAPGSPAAEYERKLVDHPTRFAITQTLGGVAVVLGPLILMWLAARVAIDIPVPSITINLPDISWPELPNISWPDLPRIDVPALPEVTLPGWLTTALSYLKYVWPIVLAYVLARGEIKRRREQAERRRAQREQQGDSTDRAE